MRIFSATVVVVEEERRQRSRARFAWMWSRIMVTDLGRSFNAAINFIWVGAQIYYWLDDESLLITRLLLSI